MCRYNMYTTGRVQCVLSGATFKIMAINRPFLTLFVFGVILSNSFSDAAQRQPHKKVLILGAGLSGIIAGKTLLDNGVDDFLILEGQDYIGGRIKQKPFAGYEVEEGANWIHSYEDDDTKPLWELKKKTRLKGVQSHWNDFIMRNETGANVTDMASYNLYDKIVSSMEDLQEQRNQQKKPPISARIALSLLGWRPNSPARQAIEYFNVDYEFGEKPEEVPFDVIGPENVDYFVTDQRGMITLYRGIYEKFKIKIRLNKAVKEIKYSSNGVEVTTSNGEVYTADYGICTFSTGVLGSDMVKFVPQLPDWKLEAIWKMPMVVFTKIFLKFPRKFWDDNEFIMFAARQRGHFPVFQNLEKKGMFPGSGLLLIITTEDEGRRVERQSNAETKAELYEMLKGVYGKDIPEPTDIFYSRWSTNLFVRGSYCDSVLGTTDEDMKNLARNVGNLFFAGDATNADWYGFMQGAYIAGKEKGEIVSKLTKNKNG